MFVPRWRCSSASATVVYLQSSPAVATTPLVRRFPASNLAGGHTRVPCARRQHGLRCLTERGWGRFSLHFFLYLWQHIFGRLKHVLSCILKCNKPFPVAKLNMIPCFEFMISQVRWHTTEYVVLNLIWVFCTNISHVQLISNWCIWVSDTLW